jgi:hypothetical protein
VAGFVGLGIGLASMGTTCYHELSDGFATEHCDSSPNYLAYGIGAGSLIAGVGVFLIGVQRVWEMPPAQVSSWVVPGGGGLSLRLRL